MKLNIANPWTRFYLSCGAVVFMFCVFILLYSLYKHPYYGPRFLGINFFKEVDKSTFPLYELSEGEACVKLISSESADVPKIKPVISEAQTPHCKSPLIAPADIKKIPKDVYVGLALFILPDGNIKRADLDQSSGNENLDKIVLEQIKNAWQFEPCKKAGIAIECRQVVRVKWK